MKYKICTEIFNMYRTDNELNWHIFWHNLVLSFFKKQFFKNKISKKTYFYETCLSHRGFLGWIKPAVLKENALKVNFVNVTSTVRTVTGQ